MASAISTNIKQELFNETIATFAQLEPILTSLPGDLVFIVSQYVPDQNELENKTRLEMRISTLIYRVNDNLQKICIIEQHRYRFVETKKDAEKSFKSLNKLMGKYLQFNRQDQTLIANTNELTYIYHTLMFQ